ncbi:MAG: hypothetical protein M3Z28_03335 [Candidatus Dormibacteraeota bacterium]|nr:hypothetical protein [Candidatus Dormibacteraeota bacterium]
MPLPLLPVVGACGAGCRLLLLLVGLELVVVVVVVLAAVAVGNDLPAYEAAATKPTPTTATNAPAVAP